MISITAYDLLNIIVEGEVTTQVLGLNLVSRGHSKTTADETVLNCLIELCEAGFIACQSRNDYGSSSPKDRGITNTPDLIESWTELFGINSGPTNMDENKTITIEITDLGRQIVVSEDYDLYLPILKSQFQWPEDLEKGHPNV